MQAADQEATVSSATASEKHFCRPVPAALLLVYGVLEMSELCTQSDTGLSRYRRGPRDPELHLGAVFVGTSGSSRHRSKGSVELG